MRAYAQRWIAPYTQRHGWTRGCLVPRSLGAMPFLLLLSALLTALTGAVTGVRAVEISAQRPSLAAGVQQVAILSAQAVGGHAHLLGAFGIAAAFAVSGVARPAAPAAPRLYLDRPRA